MGYHNPMETPPAPLRTWTMSHACTTCDTPTRPGCSPARADLQVVKQRLGHQSTATTDKHLHTLPTAHETALTALRRIRHDS